jgi:3-oxoacyl-[acyl-carrier-protein] synthase-3
LDTHVIGSRVSGVGMALPSRELTNAELAPRLNLTDQWILERTGISSRRVAADDESASSLGLDAAAEALADAELDAADIDLIVSATVTPDWRFPATACLIQSALGARATAFDINAGCSGFLFALAQVDAAIRSGVSAKALVVGCEVLSRITDYSDPRSAVLFGDGAGAVVVEGFEGTTRVGPFRLFSDGSRPELLYVPNDTGLIRMSGREVYRAAVDGMTSSVRDLLSDCGMAIGEVDVLVAHQANQRILAAVGERLGIDPQRLVSNIGSYGNTSAASIPIALYEAQKDGRLTEGRVVVITAFGAGFCWGAGLVRWGTSSIPAATLQIAESANV